MPIATADDPTDQLDPADAQPVVEDDLETSDRVAAPLLFDQPVVKGRRIAIVGVERIEPSIEEGWLGKLDPHATEHDLKQRWGGGRYRITGRAETGQIVRQRFVSIAGEPRFESMRSRVKWRTMQQIESEDALEGGPKLSPEKDPSIQLYRMQLEQLKADAERRDRIDRERSERLEREAIEREERREREAKEREDRRQREIEESRTRDREHMQTMISMLTANRAAAPDPNAGLETLIKGMELADRFGGGGRDEESEFSTMAKEIISGVYGGWKESKSDEKEGSAKLTGKTAEALRKFVRESQRAGINPDEVLSAVLEKMAGRAREARAARVEAHRQKQAAKKKPPAPAPAPKKKPKPASD